MGVINPEVGEKAMDASTRFMRHFSHRDETLEDVEGGRKSSEFHLCFLPGDPSSNIFPVG